MASELADMLRRRAAILLQRRAIGDHEDGRRMNNAADALDARDRDVAELVAALDDAIVCLRLHGLFDAKGAALLAKHKGGA